MTKNGAETIDAYLTWLKAYYSIIQEMKRLEREILKYKQGLDSVQHKQCLDRMHKEMRRVRKQCCKAEMMIYWKELSK